LPMWQVGEHLKAGN